MAKRRALPVGLDELASKHLGIDVLRPGQEAGLSALLAGRDTLVIMPTGGGKSAIYPAVLVQGFDRPNIDLSVERVPDKPRKQQAVLDRVLAAPKPGIGYKTLATEVVIEQGLLQAVS